MSSELAETNAVQRGPSDDRLVSMPIGAAHKARARKLLGRPPTEELAPDCRSVPARLAHLLSGPADPDASPGYASDADPNDDLRRYFWLEL